MNKVTFDEEVRIWYIKQVKAIPPPNSNSPLRDQALEVFRQRNRIRNEARERMSDQEAVKKLELEFPAKTFSELVRYKMLKKGLTLEEAYMDIIKTALKTNAKFDERIINPVLGLDKNGNIRG